MDKASRNSIYLDYLRSEGFQPSVDGDGDVTFKYEGKTLFILADSKDDMFFRVIMPGLWKIDDESERVAVEHVCVEATAGTKVAKVFVVKNTVWASIELFVSTPEGFKPVFARSLSALGSAVEAFAKGMIAWREEH